MKKLYHSKSKVIISSLVILLIAICINVCILKPQAMQVAKNNISISALSEEAELQSEIYIIEEGCISRILPQTTLRDLKNNLDEENINVYNEDESLLEDTELVGTGMKLVYKSREYKLAVLGDLNGDGKVSITDLTQMKLVSVGLREKLENEYAIAGDMNNDGKISITDLTKINLATVNLIDIIAPETFIPEVVTTKDTVTVQGEMADINSGVKECWFEINNNGWIQNIDKLNNKYTFTGLDIETEYCVRMKVIDNAGNAKITKRIVVETLNNENENISITENTTEWTKEDVLVSIKFSSNLANEKKQISLDNGNTWEDYTTPITVNKNLTMKIRAVNSNGEVVEEKEKAITNIDKLGPKEFNVITEATVDSIKITASTEDAKSTETSGKSGLAGYKFKINNEEWTEIIPNGEYTFTELVEGETYKITAKAIDNVGNETIATNCRNSENGALSIIPSQIPDYYGKEVTNYESPVEGINWRVFYKDNDNIYLITDDYIPYESIPVSTNGTLLTKGDTDYSAHFTNLLEEYTGSAWIRDNTNEEAQKWLSKYLRVYPNSTNENIRLISYMMDTDTWSSFAGDNAEYAIGGPTLEMFCESYKVTHPNKYVECDVSTVFGYQLKWNDGEYTYGIDSLERDDFNEIYIKNDVTKAEGIWVASIGYATNVNDVIRVSHQSINNEDVIYIGSSVPYLEDMGFRPIVCLKSGNQLVNNGDGTYSIEDMVKSRLEIIGNTNEWSQSKTLSITAKDKEYEIENLTINGVEQELVNGICTYIANSNGTYTIEAIDKFGNIITEKVKVNKIDTLAPYEFEIGIETTANSIRILANTSDAEAMSGYRKSGIAGYKFKINDEEWTEIIPNGDYTYTDLVEGQTYKIVAKAIDKAGNETIANDCKNNEDGTFHVITIAIPDYYGAEVTNYECSALGVDKWRVFYKDDSNTYIIADDYIENVYMPEGTNGTRVESGITLYNASFSNVLNDYTGSEWIRNNTNEKAQKWLNKYLSAYPNSTDRSIKSVAYMMDTEAWSKFAGDDAEYAIGGPTLEMFCESYKATHPNKYIVCDNVEDSGYKVKWSNGSYGRIVNNLTKDCYNSIYTKSDHTKSSAMWIASPSAVGSSDIMFLNWEGNLYDTNYSYTGNGFRPVVCLKSEVELINNGDGTYSIR